MRVVEIVGARTSRVVEAPEPEPGPGDVLVRTLASGVCASERPVWTGHDGGRPTRIGHELSGEVVGWGRDVHGWRVGDRVTGFAHPAFAELVAVPSRDLEPVPANVPSWAALGEPLACVVEAVSRSGIQEGARVAVVGMGFMGLVAAQVVRAAGAGEVLALDVDPARLDLAARLGADATFAMPNPADNPADDVAGVPPDLRTSCDVVVEFTGTAAGLAAAGDLTRAHGTLCVGGYHHDGRRDLDVELWYRSVTIVNGFSADRGRQRAALRHGLALMAAREVTFEPLVTHRLGLDGLDDAYELFRERPAGFVKAVLEP